MEIIEINFPILYSTNTWVLQNALLLAREKLSVISADEQSAGRGRHKNRWFSPKGENLYASFCFFCEEEKNVSNTPQILALSVVEVLQKLGLEAKVKWPNDLLIHKKKIAGILSETKSIGALRLVCLGLGLNINMKEESLKNISNSATSLYFETNRTFNIDEVKKDIAKNFNEKISVFLKEGFDPFYEPFKSCLALDGPLVFKDNSGKLQKGNKGRLNRDGSLSLELEEGSFKTFFSGELLTEHSEL